MASGPLSSPTLRRPRQGHLEELVPDPRYGWTQFAAFARPEAASDSRWRASDAASRPDNYWDSTVNCAHSSSPEPLFLNGIR